jgi:hypothetical protein
VADVFGLELVLDRLQRHFLAEEHRDDAARTEEAFRLPGVDADLIGTSLLDDADNRRRRIGNRGDGRRQRDAAGRADVD